MNIRDVILHLVQYDYRILCPTFNIAEVLMQYSVLIEAVTDSGFPDGYYYAHIPSLGLTTHGFGIEGAKIASRDLIGLWIAEKKAILSLER